MLSGLLAILTGGVSGTGCGLILGLDERRLFPDAGGSDGASSSIAFVQATATSTAAATANVAFERPVGAHSAIIVGIDFDNFSQTMLPVTDSLGSRYQTIMGPVDNPMDQGGLRHYLAFASDVMGGAVTVTVSLTGSPATSLQVYIHEYSGVALQGALDAHTSATGTSALPDGVTSGSVMTSAAPELIFAFVTTAIASPGTGFTPRSTALQNVTEDEIAATVGSHQATATMEMGRGWTILTATFRGQ
jgi:hypothetical protein